MLLISALRRVKRSNIFPAYMLMAAIVQPLCQVLLQWPQLEPRFPRLQFVPSKQPRKTARSKIMPTQSHGAGLILNYGRSRAEVGGKELLQQHNHRHLQQQHV
ncbi:hypothetical protein RRG08_017344 [Elysia crispata]|uniref:Uncharacterized protein n=1 Tax=Elysia crispata TaxID=231223 RepID=A0AAE1ALC3_9GAST|nr:hypothetical protein RRG08_017344 [Elysia crispata]